MAGARPQAHPGALHLSGRSALRAQPAGDRDGRNQPRRVGTFLADIDHGTDVLDLATRIAEAYRADLAEGVIAQSLLHFTPSYEAIRPACPTSS